MSGGQSKPKSVFVCQRCGRESAKWLGRCPDCLEWNSFIESTIAALPGTTGQHCSLKSSPRELSEIEKETLCRLDLGFGEMNRVLGGGLVPGSLVLIGGEPGIGKSTLLLQLSAKVAKTGKVVAYVSGEESASQVKLRSERLGIEGRGIYFLSETKVNTVLDWLEQMSPGLVVVDSIQTMYLEDVAGVPGSVSQVRECTWALQRWAKPRSIPLLIAGHVTKEGAIAGPGTLEHIVDVVLYLEGEPFSSYRILRGTKNRFGSTNEVGIFEMAEKGLVEVDNPSQVFLSAHTDGTIGSVVVATLEGSRPLLVEIQALTIPNGVTPPRRIANGVDFNRLLLIIAVLTKRAGLRLFNQDVIVNVTGGLKLSEPAVDLGIATAIASSVRNSKPIPGLIVLGELGLNGELRGVPQLERRIAEAVRLGFKACLIPKLGSRVRTHTGEIELIQANTIVEALKLGLTK